MKPHNLIPILRMLIFFAVLPVAACTGFYARHPDADYRIDALVERHEYDRAIEILAASPPAQETAGNRAQRIRAIEQQRDQTRDRFLAEIRHAGENGEWHKALAAASEARAIFPETSEFIVMQDQYEKLRHDHIRQNRFNIMLARARYLSAIREYEENLLMARPDDRATRRRYRDYRESLTELSGRLYDAGKEAFYEKNTRDAIAALSSSQKLHPCEKNRSLLQEARRIQKEERAAARERAAERGNEAEAVEVRRNTIERRFRQAMDENDLAGARRAAGEMAGIDPEKAAGYEKHLEIPIDKKTRALQARGRMLYGQGLIREALELWQEALELKPDHPELIQSIHRARTFLENLDRWKENDP